MEYLPVQQKHFGLTDNATQGQDLIKVEINYLKD